MHTDYRLSWFRRVVNRRRERGVLIMNREGTVVRVPRFQETMESNACDGQVEVTDDNVVEPCAPVTLQVWRRNHDRGWPAAYLKAA